MGAIYVMWKRQLKGFVRAKPRIVVSLFQPLLFFVAFGFGFGPTFAKAGGGDYIEFLAPGIIAMTILFGSVMNGVETIMDKQFGFLKETLVAPVPRYKIMLGRALGGATVAFCQGFFVLLITFLFGFRVQNYFNLIFVFGIMFLIALIFSAFGIAIASKLDDMHAFPMIINFLVMPIFFLSGALFSLEGLPEILGFLTRFNPLVYGVDAMRGFLGGSFSYGMFFDLCVLIPLAFVMILLGAYSFSKIEV